MKRILTCTALALILAQPLMTGAALAHGTGHGAAPAAPAMAADVTLGDITISGAYARATLPRAPVGGAFMLLKNAGAAEDRLVAVSAPVGDHVEIHEMAMADGVMTMRPVEGGIVIPAGGMVELAPGGYHLMIMGLTEPLTEGSTLPLELTFEKAGKVTVPFTVGPINAKGGKAHGADCEHDGEGHECHEGHGTHGGHGGHGGHGAAPMKSGQEG